MHRWDSCEQLLEDGSIGIDRIEVGTSREGGHRCDPIAAADIEHVALHGACVKHEPHGQIIQQLDSFDLSVRRRNRKTG